MLRRSVNVEVKMNRRFGVEARRSRRPAIRPQGAPLLKAALACALVLFLSPLAAQQNTQPAAQQATPQPPAPSAQQPGAGAQVHTGTSSGLNIDARLQNLLANHQYFRVASQLGQLPVDQAQFYRGILANRRNDLKTSVELLAPLVDQVTASGNTGVPADGSNSAGWSTAHEKLLRMALAEDYLRLGDWAKAAQAYQTLDTRLHAKLTPDEQDEIEMPLKLLPLAKDNPPTTVEPCAPFTAPGERGSPRPPRRSRLRRRALPRLDARSHRAFQSHRPFHR